MTCMAMAVLVATMTGAQAPAGASAPSSQPAVVALSAPSSQPNAEEPVASTVCGESPSYQDVRVSDRSPGLTGQTGLLRVLSAKTGSAGYLDVGWHARYFRVDDFVIADSVDQGLAGELSLGFTLNPHLELALSGLISANENSAVQPRATYSTGAAGADLKLAVPVSMFAFGLDAHAAFPSGRDGVGPDLGNFGAQAQALATLDLWEQRGIPLRVHLNGGYFFQYRGTDRSRLLKGWLGHLLAVTYDYTYFDRASYGLAVEAPLPYATPFVELTGEYLFGPGLKWNDSQLRLTPGVRITPGHGLAFDLGADIRLLGGRRLIEGVPTAPPWQAQLGFSYSFSPLVAETRVETREVERRVVVETPHGFVTGRVLDGSNGVPVAAAVISFEPGSGPRIVADAEGRYRSYRLPTGRCAVAAAYPDYRTGQSDVVIIDGDTATLDLRLVPESHPGQLRGVIIDEYDRSVKAALEVTDAAGAVRSVELAGGSYQVDLAPGRVGLVVKSSGYLAQGRQVTVYKSSQTIADFVLKAEPPRRVTLLRKRRIEVKTAIHFEADRWRVLADSYLVLDEVADVLLRNPQIGQLRVEGHTDDVGDAAANKLLSENRARAIVDYLIGHGVDASRLQAVGYGQERPIASIKTNAGRTRNRRVDFVIVEPETAGAASQQDESRYDTEVTTPGDGDSVPAGDGE